MANPKPRRTTQKGSSSPQDAIAMLVADHQEVKELFKRFETLKDQEDTGSEKASLVEQACQALTVHTQLEEEIIYPAVRGPVGRTAPSGIPACERP